MSDWRTDTKAMTIQGASGAGKTTTVRGLSDQFPGPSIVFDLDEEPELGTEVESIPELADALARGATEIVFRSPVHVIEEPEVFPEVVRWLMQIGNELRGTEQKMQFVMGEAQDLQEKWVKVAVKRLRKRNIKPVVETQDPFSMPTRIRTQAEYQAWVGRPNDQQRQSMRSTNWPQDLLANLGEHEMLVLGDGWQPMDRMRVGGGYVVE